MRTIAVGLAVFSLVAEASATEYQLKRIAKTHKELMVRGYFDLKDSKDSACESTDRPVEIDLNSPPKGGIVCKRSGMVNVESIWSGKQQHCIGRKISGVFVIYIPFRRFSGLDTMLYTVRMQQTRTFRVEINVEAAKAAGASAAPSEPQQEGPMPVCAALVS
jgi:hypothetical protein